MNDQENIIAHIAGDGREQTLMDHLRGTARLAEEFAGAFGDGAWGKATGILHDDGKASDAFQRKIRGVSIHVDHFTPWAKYAMEKLRTHKGVGKLVAYRVAGHHAGIPDGAIQPTHGPALGNIIRDISPVFGRSPNP